METIKLKTNKQKLLDKIKATDIKMKVALIMAILYALINVRVGSTYYIVNEGKAVRLGASIRGDLKEKAELEVFDNVSQKNLSFQRWGYVGNIFTKKTIFFFKMQKEKDDAEIIEKIKNNMEIKTVPRQ